jgi:probable poly-beta-1,6-N-acetyl-D-glucosamine export protein
MKPVKNLSDIRFIAMLGVLFVHSTEAFTVHYFDNANHFFSGTRNDFLFFSVIVNLCKFSTIAFFIISGYLFQLNEEKYSSSFKKFITNKYKKLLKPYLVIFILPIVIYHLILKRFLAVDDDITFASSLLNIVKQVFLSSYWFIPVLLFYFIVNFFLPYKYIKYIFLPSLAITLFYAFNLYFPLIPTNHTLSFLGFLSFFLLGRISFNTNLNMLPKKRWLVISIFLLGFVLTVWESWFLNYSFQQHDSWNTLKLSNILYSLGTLILLKDRLSVPKPLLKVDTYFIYLIHPHLKLGFLKLVLFLEAAGIMSASSKFNTILYIVVFIMGCYMIERIYTKIKNNPFEIRILKASLLLRSKS